jgi:serine/threonine protein kinase
LGGTAAGIDQDSRSTLAHDGLHMTIAADGDSGSTMDRGSGPAGGTAYAPLPEQIDRYRIVRQIGEGGMGVVYLARQEDPVQRDVALKVLRTGTESGDVIARFATERQALALMEHPNITHVFDAGLTPGGQPYFVMELVDGIAIDEFASRSRMPTRGRVQLFVQVCRAVQHAHQKGIIHRDLKPSNVLVVNTDADPLCKVIDFGIAKATGDAGRSARITATGMSLGTPAYMSPEQLLDSPSDVDTRSDIYSLGVLLYELLTGVLPGDSDGSVSWASLMRRAQGDFPSASAQFQALDDATREACAAERATDPATLRGLLHGDLDCIMLKALDPERERRYASAAALAHDLENYLADRPVDARPPSAAYRLRKFSRRHRAGVALSVLLLLVLVTTAVGATVQARRLAVARTVALSRQEQAERLIGFMLGDLSTKLRPIGRLDLLDDVDRRVLAFFESVPVGTLSDDERLRRAEALRQLGEVRLEQGRPAEAGALIGQSLALARDLATRDRTRPDYQLQLAHSEYSAGFLAWQQGQVDSALGHFVPFVRVSERLLALYPDSLEYRAQRAYALNNIGAATERKGDAPAALRHYLATRDLLAPLVARDTANVIWRIALGNVLNSIGEAQRKLGDLDGALASHLEEFRVRDALYAGDRTDADRLRLVAIARYYVGDTRLWRGDAKQAATDMLAVRRHYTALVAGDTANALYRQSLASASRRLAQAYVEGEAASLALAAVAEGRTQIARLPAAAASDRLLRETMTLDVTDARALLLAGRWTEAVAVARRAAASGERALARRPDDVEQRKATGDARLALGDALDRAGDRPGAAAAWKGALELATVPGPLARETDFLMLRVAALLRMDRVREASPDAAELVRRGVRRPAFRKLLISHGLPSGA